jgi:hypothetical protein
LIHPVLVTASLLSIAVLVTNELPPKGTAIFSCCPNINDVYNNNIARVSLLFIVFILRYNVNQILWQKKQAEKPVFDYFLLRGNDLN